MAGALQKIERVDLSAVQEIVGAEWDKQIATAKRWPRDSGAALGELRTLSTADEEIAASCLYSLERKEKGGGKKFIVGPSVRFAEILVYCWGNLRVGSRIIDEDERFVTAQGFAADLERNIGISSEVKRRITDREGRRFGDDMIGVTSAAAASIAFRNAVFDLIPQAIWMPTWDLSRTKAVGDQRTLNERVAAAIAFFVKAGATEAHIYPALGRKSRAELTLDDLAILTGLRNRIRDKEIAGDRLFHPDAGEERARLGILSDIEEGEGEAGSGDGEKPAAAEPKASPGAKGDKAKNKGGKVKADSKKETAAPESGGKAESPSSGSQATADDPKDKPAAAEADPGEDPDVDDRKLVQSIDDQVREIRGPGKSQPIRDNRGALERIKATAADMVLRKHAERLLGMYDLD